MTRLRDVRHVVAHCLRVGLGPEDGAPVAVYAAPPARVQAPCVIIYPGLTGSYLGVDGDTESVTWCEEVVYLSLIMLHGSGGDMEQAMDCFDDWLERLPGVLAEVAVTSWTDGDRVVSTEGRSPSIVEIGVPEFLQIPAGTGPTLASLQVDLVHARPTH